MSPQNSESLMPAWGLRRDIFPCFGARLIQEGNRLYFLPDRACFGGNFSPEAENALKDNFPVIVQQLETLLQCGELNPRRQHRVCFSLSGLVCEADTLGSYGYVYLTVYPESAVPRQG